MSDRPTLPTLCNYGKTIVYCPPFLFFANVVAFKGIRCSWITRNQWCLILQVILLLSVYYQPQGKVMFSEASVCSQGGGRVSQVLYPFWGVGYLYFHVLPGGILAG